MTIYNIGLSERDLKFAEDLNITDEIEICIDYLEYELCFDKDKLRDFVEKLLNKITKYYVKMLVDYTSRIIVKVEYKNDD